MGTETLGLEAARVGQREDEFVSFCFCRNEA